MKIITNEMLKTLTIDDIIDLYRLGYVLPMTNIEEPANDITKIDNKTNPFYQDNLFNRIRGAIIESCTKKLNKSLSELNKSLNEPGTVRTIKNSISECLNNQALYPNFCISDEECAFNILGISSESTNSQIKKRYKELSREYNPDKALHTTDGIKILTYEKFKQIKCAFDFLKKERNF